MTPVSHANVVEFLHRDCRLRPRQVSIARALLEGNLPMAKGLLAFDEAHYEPPVDNVSKGLTDLLQYLKGCLRPENYSKVELMVSALQQTSTERLAQHDREINEASSDKSTTNAGPPAQDSRPAGLRALLRTPAADSLAKVRALLDAKDTTSSDALRRAKTHMARIQVM